MAEVVIASIALYYDEDGNYRTAEPGEELVNPAEGTEDRLRELGVIGELDEEPEPELPVEPEEIDDLNELTVAELREAATERGIPVEADDRKADLIRKLGG